MTLEMELALVTFVAVVAAQLGKAGFRMLQSFVKKTPTNLDDKILAAVSLAVQGEFSREAKTKSLEEAGNKVRQGMTK